MKNLRTTWIRIALLALFGFLLNTALFAQKDSINNQENNEQIENGTDLSNQGAGDEIKENNDEEDSKSKNPIITEDTIKIISIGFFAVMILLIILFFISKMKSSNPYFGFHSIKFIGLILIFPGICILALISTELISGATLAALFGTIAGYVLSRDKEDDSDSSALKEKHKKEKQKLMNEITTLKDDIEKLKQGNP
nr:OPT/YSL family transporter [uncultured Allomuricauda sp.]